MEKAYKKTNIYLLDEGLWKWAKYRSDQLGYNSVSEWIFKLLAEEKEEEEWEKADRQVYEEKEK